MGFCGQHIGLALRSPGPGRARRRDGFQPGAAYVWRPSMILAAATPQQATHPPCHCLPSSCSSAAGRRPTTSHVAHPTPAAAVFLSSSLSSSPAGRTTRPAGSRRRAPARRPRAAGASGRRRSFGGALLGVSSHSARCGRLPNIGASCVSGTIGALLCRWTVGVNSEGGFEGSAGVGGRTETDPVSSRRRHASSATVPAGRHP